MRWTKLASAGVVGLGLVCGTFEAVRPRSTPSRAAAPPIHREILVAPVSPTPREARAQGPSGEEPALTSQPVVARSSRPALPVEPIPGAVATWRTGIFSQDASERASAVNAIPSCPEHDGVVTLQRLMTSDPDAGVRESAVLAFTQAVGRQGVAALRKVALGDADANVGSAARASLRLIDTVDPLPPRGTLSVSCDQASFSAGEWLTVRARFQAEQDVAEARLFLTLPKSWEVDPRGNVWKGSLWKGQPQEAVFAVKAGDRSGSTKLSGRLKLDFSEELDVDVVSADLPLQIEGGEGRILDASNLTPKAAVRTIELASGADPE